MIPAGGRVLALDIGGTKLAAGIGTVNGDITRQASLPTLASEGAGTVLQRAIALARQCHDEELAAGGRVDAVGVSTMGLTRATHVELAPNVSGWSGFASPRRLRRASQRFPS